MESDGASSIKIKEKTLSYQTTSTKGFIITILLGFTIYFILNQIQNSTDWFTYNDIYSNIGTDIKYKFVWMIKDFSEAPFYGGIFSSIGLLGGALLAYILDNKKSKYAGFNISYGLNIWPWVLASQILSLFISIFVLGNLGLFNTGEYVWLPTFLILVGAPQAVMAIYGPSLKALITGSILGSLFTLPIAVFLSANVFVPLGFSGGLANYIALAGAGTLVLQSCKLIPWMKKKPFKLIERTVEEKEVQDKANGISSPTWFIRRVLADFTDPLFYGNEIATIGAILGATIDWILNSKHGCIGSGVFPAILLSQLISGSVGVFLYGRKHIKDGWYPTYIPVVSVAPISVLTFGPTIPVILFSSILGGIIGAPFAELLNRNLSEDLHGYIPNVLAMCITTIFVLLAMAYLPWF